MNRLYIPFVWELFLIISTALFPNLSLYLFLIFYIGILFYFYTLYKQFSFRKLYKNLGRVVTFWIPVALTFFGLFLADKSRYLFFGKALARGRDGTVSILYHNELFPTLVYAIMMIILKPVAEELFFRKALIKFGSKKKVFAFALLSIFLCALSRAHGMPGIIEWMLMAFPVTIAYVATRNIYISLMAHVLFEFYTNIYPVAYVIARIVKR